MEHLSLEKSEEATSTMRTLRTEDDPDDRGLAAQYTLLV
jgi:hypothetical protein